MTWEGPPPPEYREVVKSQNGTYKLSIENIEHRAPSSLADLVSHYQMRDEDELRDVVESAIRNQLTVKNNAAREVDLLGKLMDHAPVLKLDRSGRGSSQLWNFSLSCKLRA